jgi:hypothetical protein
MSNRVILAVSPDEIFTSPALARAELALVGVDRRTTT